MKYFVVIAALLVSAMVPSSTASVTDSLNAVRQDVRQVAKDILSAVQSSTDPTLNNIVKIVTSSNLLADLQQLVAEVKSALQGLNLPNAVNSIVSRVVKTVSGGIGSDLNGLTKGLTSITQGNSNDELTNLLGNLTGKVSDSSNSEGLVGILRRTLNLGEDKATKASPRASPKASPRASPKASPKA